MEAQPLRALAQLLAMPGPQEQPKQAPKASLRLEVSPAPAAPGAR